MPQTLNNGITTPINADAYNLTGDLATMGNTSNVVIPVANQAARDALTPYAGMTVSRLDLTGAPLQVYDGTKWQHQGRRVKNLFNNAGITNQTGTASRLLVDLGSASAPYDRIMTANALIGVTPASIASGVSTIYISVSLMQASASNAQGYTPISWVAPGSYILGGYATTGDILVPANTTPQARMWINVITGSITTTVSTDARLTQFWTEEYPA